MTESNETTVAAEKAALEANIAEHRALQADNPQQHYPVLADSLLRLAVILSDEEKPTEALAAAREGSDQLQALYDDGDADTYRVPLAAALNNLSSRLSEAGQEEDGRKACDESIALATQAVQANGAAEGRYVLVSALMNQAGRSWRMGQPARALSDMANAVDAFREGAADLAQFLGLMVDTLHKNALTLAEADRWEEAVAMRRMMAKLFPEGQEVPLPVAHLLGLTLEQASYARSRDGNIREALPMAEEAVEVARTLSATKPETYNIFLGQTLSNLAGCQLAAGGAGNTLETALEAIKLFEDASQTDAAAVVIPLANTLDIFADALDAMGQEEQAQTVRAQREDLLSMVQGAGGEE